MAKSKVGYSDWSASLQLRIFVQRDLANKPIRKLQQRWTRCNTQTKEGDYHIEEKWEDVPEIEGT